MFLQEQRQIFKKGFSLIELVITISIVSIIALVIYPIIKMGVDSYETEMKRKKIVSRGRLALEKMSRDIRVSVPNTVILHSINNVNDSIEFGSSLFFSSYSVIDNVTSPYLLNDNSSVTIVPGPFLVVYNTYPASYYNYLTDPTPSTFPIVSTTANTITFNASIKPFSPFNRYSISNGPVCYSLNPSNQLVRYSMYSPGGNFITDSAEQNILIDNVESLSFSYTSGTLTNEAIISIVLKIKVNNLSMDFHQEVHIRNVP